MVVERYRQAWIGTMVWLIASCSGSGGTERCEPGQEAACSCPGEEAGVKVCRSDGLGFEECDCDRRFGAGDPCSCLGASCVLPCPQEAGAAGVCMVIETESGEGFCSFACLGEDQECTVDFPSGCCMEVAEGSGTYCMPSDYCQREPRKYLETCGTLATGDCLEGLRCAGFGMDEGVCLYTCLLPAGVCQDEGVCTDLEGGEGICIPPGNGQQGELCEIPLAGCQPGLECYYAFGQNYRGYCTVRCDCQDGEGCPGGQPVSDCLFMSPQGSVCWCGYACPSHIPAADCPNSGQGWVCQNLGTTEPFWMCLPE